MAFSVSFIRSFSRSHHGDLLSPLSANHFPYRSIGGPAQSKFSRVILFSFSNHFARERLAVGRRDHRNRPTEFGKHILFLLFVAALIYQSGLFGNKSKNRASITIIPRRYGWGFGKEALALECLDVLHCVYLSRSKWKGGEKLEKKTMEQMYEMLSAWGLLVCALNENFTTVHREITR